MITTFVFTTWLTSSAFAPTDIAEQAANTSDPGHATAKLEVAGIIATHTTWLSWGTALAGLAIALIAPVLGARADAGGRRKLWLGINTTAVVILSMLLFFVTPDQENLSGNVVLGIVILAAGNIFFELASVNYNAMLNQISTPTNRGRISGIGWGAGYLGGIVLLVIVYFGLVEPEVGVFGITGENGLDIRVAVLFSALWFAAFAIPVFRAVPEQPSVATVPPTIMASYRKVGADIARLWRTDRTTLRFLFSAAIYRDGLAGVFLYGGILASGTFGFTSGEVILFAIGANVVSGIATIVFGFLEDRVGARLVIIGSLLGMIVSGLVVFLGHNGGPTIFWIFGLMLCIFVGPVQSASRSTVSRLATPTTEGELFGLYAMTGRVVSFLAPLSFGVMVAIFDEQRFGILGLIAILAVGLVLVWPLNLMGRDRSTAHRAPIERHITD